MSAFPRTDQIMRVVAEARAEGVTERGFALADAARAAIEQLEAEVMACCANSRLKSGSFVAPAEACHSERSGSE